jgi:hypothetical protein
VQEFYLLRAKYYTQRNILKRGRNQGRFSHFFEKGKSGSFFTCMAMYLSQANHYMRFYIESWLR